MEWTELKQVAAEMGIDALGQCHPDGFPLYQATIRERTEYRRLGYRSEAEFLAAGEPQPEYRSILVVVCDYFYEAGLPAAGLRLSNYSRFCWSTVNAKAERLAHFLKARGQRVRRLELPARAAACKAGLGFIGKNTLFYLPGRGSYVGIATYGTDLDLAVDRDGAERRPQEGCQACNRCIRACPTGAIDPEGYRINPLRCISFINRHAAEANGMVWPVWDYAAHPWLHGCEICQEVCPVNHAVAHRKDVVFEAALDLYGAVIANEGTVAPERLMNLLPAITSEGYRRYVRTLCKGFAAVERSGGLRREGTDRESSPEPTGI